MNRTIRDLDSIEAIQLAKIVAFPCMKESDVRHFMLNPDKIFYRVDGDDVMVMFDRLYYVVICRDGFLGYYMGHEASGPSSESMASLIRAYFYLRHIGIDFDITPHHEQRAYERLERERAKEFQDKKDEFKPGLEPWMPTKEGFNG